jgi:hypothetical protein
LHIPASLKNYHAVSRKSRRLRLPASTFFGASAGEGNSETTPESSYPLKARLAARFFTASGRVRRMEREADNEAGGSLEPDRQKPAHKAAGERIEKD